MDNYIKDKDGNKYVKESTIKVGKYTIHLTEEFVYDPESVKRGYELMKNYAAANFLKNS